jgi:hypothetical protein
MIIAIDLGRASPPVDSDFEFNRKFRDCQEIIFYNRIHKSYC